MWLKRKISPENVREKAVQRLMNLVQITLQKSQSWSLSNRKHRQTLSRSWRNPKSSITMTIMGHTRWCNCTVGVENQWNCEGEVRSSRREFQPTQRSSTSLLTSTHQNHTHKPISECWQPVNRNSLHQKAEEEKDLNKSEQPTQATEQKKWWTLSVNPLPLLFCGRKHWCSRKRVWIMDYEFCIFCGSVSLSKLTEPQKIQKPIPWSKERGTYLILLSKAFLLLPWVVLNVVLPSAFKSWEKAQSFEKVFLPAEIEQCNSFIKRKLPGT